MFAFDVTGISRLPSLAGLAINTYPARAVLEGVMPGRVWGDDPRAPHAVHALHPYGMSLIWGLDVAAALPALQAHLRAGAYRRGPELLQIDPAWAHLPWDDVLEVGKTTTRFTRVNFRFDAAVFCARHPAPRLPAGWRLRPLRAEDFSFPGLHVTPTAFWPDAGAFLAHGGGMGAEKDGRLGAMAFSAFRFDDALEIGIETCAPFRALGLGRAAAVALIQRCLQEGLTPVWSCRRENAPSYNLAQQLGFVPTITLPFYCLSAARIRLTHEQHM